MDKHKDKITALEIVVAASQVLTVICIFKASLIGNLASLYRGEYFGTVKQTLEKELAIINRKLPLDKKVWLKVAESVNVIDEQELLDEQLESTSKYRN